MVNNFQHENPSFFVAILSIKLLICLYIKIKFNYENSIIIFNITLSLVEVLMRLDFNWDIEVMIEFIILNDLFASELIDDAFDSMK